MGFFYRTYKTTYIFSPKLIQVIVIVINQADIFGEYLILHVLVVALPLAMGFDKCSVFID